MGNFTRSITKEYDFDGDHIIVNMSRLQRKEALLLAPYIEQNADGETSLKFSDQVAFMEVGGDVLTSLVKIMDGIVVEGSKLTTEEAIKLISSELYFMKLLSDIIGDLMTESFVGGDDVGKSERPVENSLEAIPTMSESQSEA